MARTLSAGLTAHLAQHSHTRCTMLLLDLIDGTSIGITDHDQDIPYDIGDGSVVYDAGTGILTSDVSQSCGLDASNYEITGPITEHGPVTLDVVLGGRFNRARARLFQVNWKNTAGGAIKIMAGTVTEARVEGGKFVMEIRDDFDFYNQPVGRLITNQCDADFGDGRCQATPVTSTGTVAAVTDAMRFTVSYTGGPYADNYFDKGTVLATSGALAGTLAMEIVTWDDLGSAHAAITLFAPLAENPAIGTTFTIKQGCGKSRADCMARNNIANFRGYPEVPGSDQVLQMPTPGA